MAKTAADLILILRNVTGRVDASDPQFTDAIMLQYLQDFIQLQSTQDIRIFKNMTWYEFLLDPDASPNPLYFSMCFLVVSECQNSLYDDVLYFGILFITANGSSKGLPW